MRDKHADDITKIEDEMGKLQNERHRLHGLNLKLQAHTQQLNVVMQKVIKESTEKTYELMELRKEIKNQAAEMDK